MRVSYFRHILVRDLRAVRREVEAYPDEADLWRVPEGISNSAGNLALHVAGNLQAFVGAVLGGDRYLRDREAEFGRREVSREELVAEIDRTIEAVGAALEGLPEDRLEGRFPLELAGMRVAVGDFLVHLAVHLGFHLGQIDYHRRLVTGRNETVGAIRIPELGSATPGE